MNIYGDTWQLGSVLFSLGYGETAGRKGSFYVGLFLLLEVQQLTAQTLVNIMGPKLLFLQIIAISSLWLLRLLTEACLFLQADRVLPLPSCFTSSDGTRGYAGGLQNPCHQKQPVPSTCVPTACSNWPSKIMLYSSFQFHSPPFQFFFTYGQKDDLHTLPNLWYPQGSKARFIRYFLACQRSFMLR